MRKILLLQTVLFSCFPIIAQDNNGAEKLINEGISLYDNGKLDEAIQKYDKALSIDPENFTASYEKSLTFLAQNRYEETIQLCQSILKTHSGKVGLKDVYVNYGNALDGLKQSEKALAIYDQGSMLFPTYYGLYFNKAITLIGMKKYDDAILSLQQSIKCNPNHIRSHTVLSRILLAFDQRIPSIFANSRALILEPEGDRAKENFANLQKIMKGNAKMKDDGTVEINYSKDMLPDSTVNHAVKENDFSLTDVLLPMLAGLDFDSKYKNTSDVEKLSRKFKSFCESLKETQKENYGFYWDYYAPYFIEMNDKDLVLTFAYITFASTGDDYVKGWLKTNKVLVDDFYRWSNSFKWFNK
ncbi:MAG: tetratricopeptide repeat protein [Bacteroidales bacterium]|nr:tetratricopeptide repeat protein [Bacteroidales bacterium]